MVPKHLKPDDPGLIPPDEEEIEKVLLIVGCLVLLTGVHYLDHRRDTNGSGKIGKQEDISCPADKKS